MHLLLIKAKETKLEPFTPILVTFIYCLQIDLGKINLRVHFVSSMSSTKVASKLKKS